MAKCTFHFFGSSGDVQKHDALCILPLNIINEKIYILVWFWFMALAFLSGMALIYRIVTVLSPHVRFLLLKSRARLSDRYQLGLIVEKIKSGDWFVLYQLSKNMDPISFRDLIQEFVKCLKAADNNGKCLINRHKNDDNEFEIRA